MLRVHAGPRHIRPTYDDGARQPYRRIAPAPLSPTVGAEIGGVSLAVALDDETFAEIHRALLDFTHTFGRFMGAEELKRKQAEFPPAEHRVVRTHSS